MFNYGKDNLTTGKALQLLRGELIAKIDISTRKKIQKCYDEVVSIAQSEAAVYGINTGFGPLCNTKISKDKTKQLQRNILLSHSVGVGEPVAKDISKLMLILKIHALSQGFSGIAPDVLDRIIFLLENDIIPVVPEQGSVGASGDLAPLSHLFLPLIGEGKVFYQNKITNTSNVYKKLKVSALELGPKAGLALINGTQFIAAHAVMVVEKLHTCLAHADIIAGLMIEGLKGSSSPFMQELHAIRPYKGNIHVAKRVQCFLKGSQILKSHKDCDRVQDPYSMRCVPQVHGASRSAWLHLKESVEIEINSVTDNPIVFSKDFTISGGNFHGQPLALPIDYACLAAAELGNISDRRSYLSLEGKYGDVPKLLMKDTGVNSGFMILQYTSAALVSENKGLCFPASADSIPTSLGQEDHVSMGSIGGRKALKVCNNLVNILSVEMLCAAQAIDFQRPLKSSRILEQVHAEIRKNVTHAREDRIFSKDIEKVAKLIESKSLIVITNKFKRSVDSDFENIFEKY
ncbi:MAG: histidine ammonia-lyase [Saprospiraceae bacterium]|nr:histidine ammonia-lyase [Saprospiraceae bacterium]MDG2417870.1 histidine ammonia-lyase [Saprospiraceae bacterium]